MPVIKITIYKYFILKNWTKKYVHNGTFNKTGRSKDNGCGNFHYYFDIYCKIMNFCVQKNNNSICNKTVLKASRTVELGRENFRRENVKYSNKTTCVIMFRIPVWKSQFQGSKLHPRENRVAVTTISKTTWIII